MANEDVTFRWVSGEELDLLKPVLEARGWTALDPVFSKALVAEDAEGTLIGFNVLRAVLRPEPLWVDPKKRGGERRETDLALELSTRMIDHLRECGVEYYEVKIESPFAERLCLANGMVRLETPMYAAGGR